MSFVIVHCTCNLSALGAPIDSQKKCTLNYMTVYVFVVQVVMLLRNVSEIRTTLHSYSTPSYTH